MYNTIKKQNGEAFARVLRENVLLEIPNLKHILEFAGKNPEDAKHLVPVLREIRDKSKETPETIEEQYGDPIELLSQAGYDAFYVETEEQKNSIIKYYRPGEALCTFTDPNRHKNYYIIHAVKRGAENIRPSKTPMREDEYGTSVISIQIARNGGFISIKNRYNHTIAFPDSTFNNNPDNIIPGLTEALKHKFGVDFMTAEKSVMPDNYRLINDQLVRFNYEVDNVYFDEKYYFEGSTITKINPDYEIILDDIILDTRTGYLSEKKHRISALCAVLNKEIYGNKIKVAKDKSTGETIIYIVDENKNEKELAKVKDGCITSLHLYKTTHLGHGFLEQTKNLRELYAPKLEKMEDWCFKRNETLEVLYVPELQEMGPECFHNNLSLKELNMPKLVKMGRYCFYLNENIENLYLPELVEMENNCFCNNRSLQELSVPNLKTMDIACFSGNEIIKKIYIPELQQMGDSCFTEVIDLPELSAPKLTSMGDSCFSEDKHIKKIYIPELKQMGYRCFYSSVDLTELKATKLTTMGNFCFHENESIQNLYIPELQQMGDGCFYKNKALTEINAQNLTDMGRESFKDNEILEHLYAPELIRMGEYCFGETKKLKSLFLPKLVKMGYGCFQNSSALELLQIPELEDMEGYCFGSANSLTELKAPKLRYMGDGCFFENETIEQLYVPELIMMGDNAFQNNKALKEFNAPNLTCTGRNCFYINEGLERLYIPKMEKFNVRCFVAVKKLKALNAPNLTVTESSPLAVQNYIKRENFRRFVRSFLHLSNNGNSVALPQIQRDK